MKKLLKILKVVLLVVVALIVVVYINLGRIVPNAINTLGPKMTGAPVVLENFRLNVFTGEGQLSGFTLGNPEGFKTSHAFKVDDISIKLKPSSLLSDTIVIESILIDSPNVTLEKSLTSSNFKEILKNVESYSGTNKTAEAEAETEKEAPKEEKAGKNVVIDLIEVSGGMVNLSVKGLQGIAAPVPLPTITLTDIGKDEPKTIVEIINLVIGKIFGAAISVTADVVKGVGNLGVDAVKGVGAVLKGAADTVTGEGNEDAKENKKDQDKLDAQVTEAAKQIEKDAEAAVDALKNMFGKPKE